MATIDKLRTGSRKRYLRIMLASLALIVGGALIAPLGGYVYVAMAQEEGGAQAVEQWQAAANPRAEVWRDARRSTEGYSAVQAPGANVIMQSGGEVFRQIRNGPLATYGAWFMALMLLAIGLVFAITGGNDVEKPLSGKRVPRWAAFDRALHWTVTVLFIVLAITGLSLLYGRAVLIPLLGPEGFAAWATVAKNVHNYSGPVFVAALVVMVVAWVRWNIPKKVDLDWFLKGGMLGRHAPAERMNGGEKVWFWFTAVAGIAVAVTGVMLILPNVIESRSAMQAALLIHAALAILWIGGTFGHIYMATAGAKGALEGMVRGDVSSEWAEQHHDLWYEQLRREGKEFVAEEGERPAGDYDTRTTPGGSAA